VFADDIELPAEWECRQHGIAARLKDSAHSQQPAKTRTHWDMVRERRNESELARILDDQIKDLRAGRLVGVEVWLRERGGTQRRWSKPAIDTKDVPQDPIRTFKGTQ
jgi:hypothetical protein